MPTKFTQTVEYCFPCKHFHQHLVKSGRDPICEQRCQHPSQTQETLFGFTSQTKGRRITDTDQRPQWCPIRGDVQAEKEAENDLS